jgi:hypothetical protein
VSDDVGKKYLVGMVMDCNRLPRHNLNINWNALHSTLEHLPLRPLLKLSHRSPWELFTQGTEPHIAMLVCTSAVYVLPIFMGVFYVAFPPIVL